MTSTEQAVATASPADQPRGDDLRLFVGNLPQEAKARVLISALRDAETQGHVDVTRVVGPHGRRHRYAIISFNSKEDKDRGIDVLTKRFQTHDAEGEQQGEQQQGEQPEEVKPAASEAAADAEAGSAEPASETAAPATKRANGPPPPLVFGPAPLPARKSAKAKAAKGTVNGSSGAAADGAGESAKSDAESEANKEVTAKKGFKKGSKKSKKAPKVARGDESLADAAAKTSTGGNESPTNGASEPSAVGDALPVPNDDDKTEKGAEGETKSSGTQQQNPGATRPRNKSTKRVARRVPRKFVPRPGAVYVVLPPYTEPDEVRELLSGFPSVEIKLGHKRGRVVTLKNKQHKLPERAYAIVTVGEEYQQRAIEQLNGKELRDFTIVAKPSSQYIIDENAAEAREAKKEDEAAPEAQPVVEHAEHAEVAEPKEEPATVN